MNLALWDILTCFFETSRFFGNLDFGKKSRFENKLAVFRKVLKVWENLYIVVALTFRCGSRRGSPGIDFSKGSGHLDLRQYWENNKRNIEKITNTNNVSDVLWDQMSRKKGGMSPRIISHQSHLPESHFINPGPLLCKVSWIFDFSVFWPTGVGKWPTEVGKWPSLLGEMRRCEPHNAQH